MSGRTRFTGLWNTLLLTAAAGLSSLGVAGAAPQAGLDESFRTFERTKLFAPDGGESDLFGTSVDLDGDRMVVGAYRDQVAGLRPGSAYVYVRGVGGWTLEAKLLSSDPEDFDGFGWSVALDGDTVFVGAPFKRTAAGAAYVFERSGSDWVETQRLKPSDQAQNKSFGTALDVQAGVAVIGAIGDDQTGPGAGTAYVFEKGTSDWFQTQKLFPIGAVPGDEFGRSVSISGSFVAIGAPRHPVAAPNQGAVYVFERVGGGFVQRHEVYASDPSPGEQFGRSLDLSGDYLVVGVPFDNVTDSAYVFELFGLSWIERAQLLPRDSFIDDDFGFDVGIDGDRIVVGSRYDRELGSRAGAAYVFEREGTAWFESAKLLAQDAEAGDQLGFAVDIQGATVAAGAWWEDVSASSSGSVYVFDPGDPLETYCHGDSAAALCPCGNGGVLGAGCANSTGAGAALRAAGSDRATADDLSFHAFDLPPGELAILFAGTGDYRGAEGAPFGDGLRCTGGGFVVRLGKQVADGGGTATWGPGTRAKGHWQPGDTWSYQVWYRDVSGGPCGVQFNLTNAVRVTFAP